MHVFFLFLRHGSREIVRDVQFLLHDLAVSAAAAVEVCPVLVPHLAAGLAAPVLPTLDEPRVPVGSDNAVIQPGPVNVSTDGENI